MLRTIAAGLFSRPSGDRPVGAANPQQDQPAGQAAAPAQGASSRGRQPTETAKAAEKGSLKSPYGDFAKVAAEGHQKYMAAGCNGCHGGTGGGGMGPPLTNPIWV
jgi:hypothetical protein